MGMFDSVSVPCPRCGVALNFQSKSGDCAGEQYRFGQIPPEVAGGLHGQEARCPECASQVKLVVQMVITPTIVPRIPQVGALEHG